jgi:antitoxin MazE
VLEVRAKLVRIGNSRGLRLSKPLLQQVGLEDEVELTVEAGLLSIRPVVHSRAGWQESAASRPTEGLLDEPTTTRFDDEEWTW